MTLQMDYQTTPGGSYTSFDMVAYCIDKIVLKLSIRHPAQLTFTAMAAQHTTPLPWGAFVRFWDDAGTDPERTAFSSSNPLFEGYVWKIDPGSESRQVHYVLYGADHWVGNTIPVMSTAWTAGSPPVEGIGAVPRLVYNVWIDNDDDYAFARANGYTVGQIFAQLMDDALYPLRYRNAAPSGSVAYDSTQLSNFTFIPQDKIVLQNINLRDAIQQILLDMYPDWAMWLQPGTQTSPSIGRRWRFYRKSNATARTITLNDFTGTYKCLRATLWQSLDGKYPAVTFYGPETTNIEIFSTLDGSLSIIDSGLIMETYHVGGGEYQATGHWRFQITDTTKQRGARLLPDYRFAEMGYDYNGTYQFVVTRSPFLQFTFDGGVSWCTVLGTNFDFQQGIADCGYPITLWIDPPPQMPTSDQRYFVPNGYRLIWAPYTTPLTVRYPSSGYSGTSNTLAGMTEELRIYAEDLAVGYEYGTPVSTPTRLAQFAIIAEEMHKARKDIALSGVIVLDGLMYDFSRLQRCVNLAGVDKDGSSITTGWESINAVVTDTEYHFSDQDMGPHTILTCSSDALDYGNISIDAMKKRLGVRAQLRGVNVQQQYIYGSYKSGFTRDQSPVIDYVAGVNYIQTTYYQDPLTGAVELPVVPANVHQQNVNTDPLPGQLAGLGTIL